MLKAIFYRQYELSRKYIEIEGMPLDPWNIHSKEHQIWIKDYMWRIVEELMESAEYFNSGRREQEALFYEEISDALHFFVEPMVMLKYDVREVEGCIMAIGQLEGSKGWYSVLEQKTFKPTEFHLDFANCLYLIVLNLGLAGNCLKNKKWKQTEVMTDINAFKGRYYNAFYHFLLLCRLLGMSLDDLYLVYMKKSVVNKFRQESKY